MEWIDVYDSRHLPTGRVKSRGSKFSSGEFRLHVFTVIQNSQGQVLLTLRDAAKETYPNLWGHTGGAVRAGETSLQAIAREVQEETGIDAALEEFIFLCTRCNPDWHSLTDLYLLRRDVPRSQIVLQAGETADARWVSFQQLEDMMRCGQLAAPDAGRWHQLKELIEQQRRP